jgi:hypothetical protein
MPYREIAVCSQIDTKHINTLCGQNVELLNVKLAVYMIIGHRSVKQLISMHSSALCCVCSEGTHNFSYSCVCRTLQKAGHFEPQTHFYSFSLPLSLSHLCFFSTSGRKMKLKPDSRSSQSQIQ